MKAVFVALGFVALQAFCVVQTACTPAETAAISADAKTVEADVMAVAPVVAAEITCLVTALAADPNIQSPVNDLALAGGVYGCFVGADGGLTVPEAQIVALVSKHRATAASIARAKTSKMVVGDAGVK